MTASSAHLACVGLGSNLDDPRRQVERGLLALDALPRTRLLRRSRLYASAPWGVANQPEFVNAAAAIETQLTPRALMEALLGVERAFGRQRGAQRWGPRILDLDLLLYDAAVIDEAGLRVPHPHLHERAFVLLPLAEVAPRLQVPGQGVVAELLSRVDVSTCRALDDRG